MSEANGDNLNGSKPNRGGPPALNVNAQRHGLRSLRLPKGCRHITTMLSGIRRAAEDAVLATHGQIDLVAASIIASVVEWERHRCLCLRWLRIEGDKLTPEQRLAFSRDAARASSERDRCLKLLGIESKPSDPWATIHAKPRELILTDETPQPAESAQ